ncbi:hypothetical protein SNE40_016954 [Patella caerulea]|uniref:Cilia- and flagella-associated protein 45 n=1 Tax=Patella caerulea TaxID=87958 RepID=A0AAN8J9H6_PATCE
MPGSAISAGSSSASSATRRAKTRQYRVVSHHSQVDETLFGESDHVTKRNEMLKDKWANGGTDIQKQANERNIRRKSGGKNGKNNRETVQVITKDLIRNLVVPTEDPSGQSMVMSRSDYYRILQAARVYSKEEKQAQLEMLKRQKEQIMDDAQERKNFMKSKDLNRQKNEKLNELEIEAKEKSEHLLAKANDMRQEQEDEIKHLNELILNAKCHAIRDAQIVEKKQIVGEMSEEEKRLDKMMEVDRQNGILIQEEIEKRRKEEQLIGAAKLMEQIQENEQEHLFELERKDQENMHMQKYIEKLMIEDHVSLEKKKQEQSALREELNKANDEILRRKITKKDQEKMEEIKVIEYQKKKAEREAAYELEQERVRLEKEREVARLRTLQERARDEQAERDALRAKRAQEQTEREWRKKERQVAQRKADVEASLKIARANQMNEKEHYLGVQAQRERAEFERVLQAQKELLEKEKLEEIELQKRRHVHADDIRNQIQTKEKQRIVERNLFFEEGIKLDVEARQRRLKLEEVKRRKLEELRSAGIPEKYLAQVERKVNQPTHITT